MNFEIKKTIGGKNIVHKIKEKRVNWLEHLWRRIVFNDVGEFWEKKEDG